jgi:hypothetical protein
MTTSCDLVAQCVAFGEPLGALAEHVTTCAGCQRMVDMPGLLAATRHTTADPGLGFSSRMTVGAQHLVSTRHRRRVVAGLAAAVATAAFGVFVVTRTPGETKTAPVAKVIDVNKDRPAVKTGDRDDTPSASSFDPDVVTLVHYANTDRNRRLSAKWSRIEKSLAPYRQLVEGATP